ncbi:MAG: hypothetical protein NTV45_04550 [Firmicutes bacterium]|nr:hypothetical protein [Bacillota bacterium]
MKKTLRWDKSSALWAILARLFAVTFRGAQIVIKVQKAQHELGMTFTGSMQ